MVSIGSTESALLPSFSFLSKEGGSASSSQILQRQQTSGVTAGDRVSFSLIQQLQSQSSNLRTAFKNTTEADTVTKIAKEGLSSISTNLDRMKELAELSIDPGTSDAERSFANAEFQSLASEIDSTITSTTFDGTLLLGGATVGGTPTSSLSLDFNISTTTDIVTLSIDSSGLQDALSDSGNEITSIASATTALTDIDNAISAAGQLSAHADTVEANLGAESAEISSKIGKFQQIGSEIEEFQQDAALSQLAENIRGLNGNAASTVQDLQVSNLFARLLDIEQPETEREDPQTQDATSTTAAAPATTSPATSSSSSSSSSNSTNTSTSSSSGS